MKKKSLILFTLLLVVAVGIATVGISWAAYIFSSGNKQVIVTGQMPIRFSADYLQKNNSEQDPVLTVNTVRDGFITLNVYNYPYGSPSEYNPRDISFRINFVLQGAMTPGKTYSVTVNGSTYSFSNDGTLTISGNTLPGDQASKIPFIITIPNKSEVRVTITPDSAELQPLSRTIRKIEVSSGSGDGSISWSAIEWPPTTPSIDKFAGFNYQISGSGSGTCTLSWNSDLIELDDYFQQQLTNDFGSSSYTVSENSITFHVDSAVRELYSIRFLRIPGKEITSFSELGINLLYTAQAPTTP